MRISSWWPLAGLCAVVSTAGAQGGARPLEFTRQAFSPAIIPSLGLQNFGPRLDGPFGNYRYQGSLALGLGAELPVTRRTGLLANVSVAPLSGQESRAPLNTSATYGKFAVVSLDAGFAARMKPRAPVFFYLGGGGEYAPRHAAPIPGGGSALEPYGTLAVGFDGVRHDRWNLRVVAADRVVFPHDPQVALLTVRSHANDWSVLIGARYSYIRTDSSARTR